MGFIGLSFFFGSIVHFPVSEKAQTVPDFPEFSRPAGIKLKMNQKKFICTSLKTDKLIMETTQLKVLLVDDDQRFLEVMKRSLESKNLFGQMCPSIKAQLYPSLSMRFFMWLL